MAKLADAQDLKNDLPLSAIVDFSNEPQETLDLYGIGAQPTHDYGRRCLLARKLVENGVRFICVVAGGGPGNQQWDAHNDIEENHLRKAAETDKPVAGLLQDLQRRGLLDSTLVVWMGDFGRTPRINTRGAQPGRDHYPRAWSSVLAGGGIRGGQVIGRTDAEAATVTERPVSTIDFMATICTILGIDANQQNQANNGRPVRIVERGATPIAGLV